MRQERALVATLLQHAKACQRRKSGNAGSSPSGDCVGRRRNRSAARVRRAWRQYCRSHPRRQHTAARRLRGSADQGDNPAGQINLREPQPPSTRTWTGCSSTEQRTAAAERADAWARRTATHHQRVRDRAFERRVKNRSRPARRCVGRENRSRPSTGPGPGVRAPRKEPQPPGSPTRGPGEPQPPSTGPGPGVRAPHKASQSPNSVCTTVVSETSAAVVERSSVLPAKCVVLDEFLAPQELEDLTRFTIWNTKPTSAPVKWFLRPRMAVSSTMNTAVRAC